MPTFTSMTSVLDTCPACICAKQTKAGKQPTAEALRQKQSKDNVSNSHTTKHALHPHQGLSIDLSFTGLSSKNGNQCADFEGANGETVWISVTNHFTGLMHGDTGMSKAAPVLWLKHFLAQCDPPCADECVCMDQGGESFNNPEVKNSFTKLGCSIHPTRADASNQNGPTKMAQQSKDIELLLTP